MNLYISGFSPFSSAQMFHTEMASARAWRRNAEAYRKAGAVEWERKCLAHADENMMQAIGWASR